MKDLLSTHSPAPQLPPILAGNFNPTVKKRVEQIYFSVANIFESWVARRRSSHTQRAYRAEREATSTKTDSVGAQKKPWRQAHHCLQSADLERIKSESEILQPTVVDQESLAAPKTSSKALARQTATQTFPAIAEFALAIRNAPPSPSQKLCLTLSEASSYLVCLTPLLWQ